MRIGSRWCWRVCVSAVAVALATMLAAASAASAGGLLGAVPHQGAVTVVPRHPALPTTPTAQAAADAPLQYHNGYVMHTNTVRTIFWKGNRSFPSGYDTAINGFLQAVAADSGTTGNVYSTATQYGDNVNGNLLYSSAYAGTTSDSSGFSASCTLVSNPSAPCVTDEDLGARVGAAINRNHWPTGPTNLYVIMTPPNVGICFDAVSGDCSDNTFCAYHSWLGFGDSDPAHSIVYAVEPYEGGGDSGCDPRWPDAASSGADVTINTLSHEHNEAVTDPFQGGWYDADGEENGDKCAWTFGSIIGGSGSSVFNQIVGGKGYLLQREWSNAIGGCFQFAGPSITSASATSGGPGDTIGLDGTNFFKVTDVRVNGVSSPHFAVTSPTHLNLELPNTTDGAISLDAAGGSATSGFTVHVATEISAVAPSSGPAGTAVTISGTGISHATAVQFAGLSGGLIPVPFSVSGGAIHATVPAAAVSGAIALTVGGSSLVSGDRFNVTPKITGVTPASAPVGGLVTITGSGFDGTSAVSFGGTLDEGRTLATANKIVAHVPAGSITGLLSVATLAGGTANGPTFKVMPNIAAWDPTATFKTGDTFDVFGTNLDDPGPGTLPHPVVKLGGLVLAPTTDGANPSGHLSFVVPDNAVTGRLSVATRTGTFTTQQNLNVVPTISSLDLVAPATAATAGVKLLLHGKTFTGTKSVKFTGFGGPATASAPFAIGSGGTSLSVTIPTTAVQGTISVTNAGGPTDSPVVQVVPKTLTISPSSGPVGTPVTIKGTGFAGDAVASVGGTSLDGLTRDSATQIRGTIGDGAATGSALVSTGAGTSLSGPTFKVTPGITTFTPTAKVGDQVTITGTNLDEVNPTGLKLGSLGVQMDSPSPSAHQIQFTVPANGISGKITLTSPSGTTVSHDQLNVPPTLDPLTTTSGPTGTKLTMTGKTITGIKSVTMTGWNGATVGVPFSTSGMTTLHVTVPTNALTSKLTVTNAGGPTPTDAAFAVVPHVAGFSSTTAPTGKTVAVSGSGFDGTSTATVGGLDASFTPLSATNGTLTLPDGLDHGQVVVSTAPGGPSLPSSGSLAASMTILGFSSSRHPGDSLTITGRGFGSSPTVTIGIDNVPATVTAHSSTSITVTIPDSPGESGRIKVSNGSTTVQSATDFTIDPVSGPPDSPQFAAAGAR